MLITPRPRQTARSARGGRPCPRGGRTWRGRRPRRSRARGTGAASSGRRSAGDDERVLQPGQRRPLLERRAHLAAARRRRRRRRVARGLLAHRLQRQHLAAVAPRRLHDDAAAAAADHLAQLEERGAHLLQQHLAHGRALALLARHQVDRRLAREMPFAAVANASAPPRRSSTPTTSAWPLRHAQCSGVIPARSRALQSAPARSRASHAESSP